MSASIVDTRGKWKQWEIRDSRSDAIVKKKQMKKEAESSRLALELFFNAGGELAVRMLDTSLSQLLWASCFGEEAEQSLSVGFIKAGSTLINHLNRIYCLQESDS